MCAPNTAAAKWVSETAPEDKLKTLLDPTGILATSEIAIRGANEIDKATKTIPASKMETVGTASTDILNAEKTALPDPTDKAVQEARRRQAQLMTMGRGRKSTFLTGPSGLTAPPTLGRKTLLGG